MIEEQIGLEGTNEEYKAFVEKFKPKKTTDDCYTPEAVAEAVRSFCRERYGITDGDMVKPFYPGGDYQRFVYPEGCTVVDNPPFSIISQICEWYMDRGIRFFLYAPTLTSFDIFRGRQGVCHIIADAKITYENGAVVNTSFVTNLEPGVMVMSCPELRKAVMAANEANLKAKKIMLPKYRYSQNVLMASMVNKFSRYGIEYRLLDKDCRYICKLDTQKQAKKALFGGGFLISEKAAEEKAAAEKAAEEKAAAIVWELSEREKEIVNSLG